MSAIPPLNGMQTTRTAALRSAFLDLLHDLTSLAAAAAFVSGAGMAAMAFAPAAANGHVHQSAVCERAAAEPTDFNIELCTGEPIDLAPERRTHAR